MDVPAVAQTALLANPDQHDRLLRLHTPLGPNVLVAETFHGCERLDGGGFRHELTALSLDAQLSLDALLGKPALLELLTADSRTQLRPFHGHVTGFERLGSNGGLARYRLVLEPWLALLRHRVDSYVFQDRTVVEIVEDIFADYAGTLAPAWRWELADRAVYARRSLTTQYEESDEAFIRRLLAEEGICFWFEHEGDASGDALGCHTLVLGDYDAAFAEAGQVRYHRADATERSDSIQHWSTVYRAQASVLRRRSWDYRSLDAREVSAEGQACGRVAVEEYDPAGPYAYPDRATGERRVRQHLEAMQVGARTEQGQGTWRRLAAGARFELGGHFNADGRYLCVQVEHEARNNFEVEVFDALERSLGAAATAGAPLPEGFVDVADFAAHPVVQAVGHVALSQAPRTGFYRNVFTAVPAATPYRPQTEDGHGRYLHPRPTVDGMQSAIVVSDGGPVLGDRDHRIKVQFVWQRGGNGSSGHPHPGGDDNAPGDGGAGTWVRVMTPWAGDNWGGVFLPRKGQEVLVAFMEGDIDRPVVVGAVYNGRGQPDAPHNQVAGGAAGATGNAPAWFDGNAHAAVYTGFKSQALASSQDGGGGYQQLRLDDTPDQGRIQLSTTQCDTTLTLGHLKGGADNVREGERGFGAELATEANGALRAGQGLLLTTEPGRHQMEAPQAQAQLAQGEALLQALQDAARQQQATLPDEPATLPAQTSLHALQEAMRATWDGSQVAGGGDGQTTGWSLPLLVGSSPAGIVSLTPRDQVWVSGMQTRLLAGQDLNWASQGEAVLAAAGGIALFTLGSQAPQGKPNQERGIALHAAQGEVSARAHKNVAKVAAKTRVTLASTQAGVLLDSPGKHLLLTAAGAYIKLEGGDIELGAPGAIEFKATRKEWSGPQGAGSQKPELGEADFKGCRQRDRLAAESGAATVDL